MSSSEFICVFLNLQRISIQMLNLQQKSVFIFHIIYGCNRIHIPDLFQTYFKVFQYLGRVPKIISPLNIYVHIARSSFFILEPTLKHNPVDFRIVCNLLTSCDSVLSFIYLVFSSAHKCWVILAHGSRLPPIIFCIHMSSCPHSPPRCSFLDPPFSV